MWNKRARKRTSTGIAFLKISFKQVGGQMRGQEDLIQLLRAR